MANLKRVTDPDPEPSAAKNLMSRRQTLAGAAKAIAGFSIGAQVMAATGADTALAQRVRHVAGGVNKPGYGPLVNHTGEMSLPDGFHYVHFGDAFTKMTDGNLTPPCHDGTTVFAEGKGIVRMIRNHEGYGHGTPRGGRYHAYDRVAKGAVTSSLFDTNTGTLKESGIVLNGTHENCNGGHTPWGSWLSCEENTEGPANGFEKKHGYVFEVPKGANRAVEPVPIKAMGRMEHEAAAIDPRSGIVYLTEDNGDPADGFYRFLPNDTSRLHKGGKLQMLAVEGRSRYNTITGQTVGEKLHCEWVTIDNPDPVEAEADPATVWREGRSKGAAQFLGVEGCHWSKGSVYFVASEGGDAEEGQIWRYTPHGLKTGTLVLLYESKSEKYLDEPDTITVSPRGGVLICEDGNGEDEAGGDNYLRILSPAGKLETFARNDTPLDLHRWEENKPGVFGRSEWSGSTYSPDGKWLFVHIQYPGRTFAITGPWEKGWG
jgi:uncharacterized protein